MKFKKNTTTELTLTENEIKLANIMYVKDKEDLQFNVNDNLEANTTEIAEIEQLKESKAKGYFEAGIKFKLDLDNELKGGEKAPDFKTYHKQQQDGDK